MPMYDYLCDECGHAFERTQSFQDAPVDTCPSCGKRPRRLISAPAIVFKGSGWYKNDSRPAAASPTSDKPADAKTGAASAAATAPSGASETKNAESKGGDSKAATPTETKSTPASTGEAAS